MRRPNWKTVSTLVTSIVIAGCQDSPVTAPSTSAVPSMSAVFAPEGRPHLSLDRLDAGATTADFKVGPSGGVYFIGRNAVVFPAYSICDPTRSSYGPGTWDDRCETIREAITIHAVLTKSAEGNLLDFTPALRFRPSDDPSRWVWLFMRTPSAVGASDLSIFSILYQSSPNAPLIDETVFDRSLRTYVDARTGFTSRRIKHFSGYVPITSRVCDAQTGVCTEIPENPPQDQAK